MLEAQTAAQSSEHWLGRLFAPKSVVLVGATEKSFWSVMTTRNFKDLQYGGKLYAVNKNGNDVFGVKGYKSVADIGEPVDVAYMMVPQSANLTVISELAAAGVKFAVVLSSGYAEIGEEGVQLQQEMVDHARSLGVTLWGPNSLGYINMAQRIPVSNMPITFPLLPPQIAVITQSGASAVELNDYAHGQNIGLSFLAATGNEAMVRIADLIDFLAEHDETKAIAVFCESIRDEPAFIRACEKARAAKKAVIIFKIGRSELAGTVARAHTGSIVGNDAVFSAMCERLGVIRVYSTEDLIATAGLVAAVGPLEEAGLCFISTSGGACTIAADAAESAGVVLPAFSDPVKAELREVLPGYGSTFNPLDFTGAWMTDPDLVAKVMKPAAKSPGIGLIAVNVLIPQMEGQGFPAGLPPLGRGVAEIDKPTVVVTTISRMLTEYSRDQIAEHGLPHVACGIDSFLRAYGKLAWWSEQIRLRPALPVIAGATQPSGHIIQGERAVLDRLAQAGVPVIPATVARTRAEAEQAAAESSDPLVLKIASPDIEHKTEVGGVRLNIAPADVGDAYDSVLAAVKAAKPNAKIDGIIVSPMRKSGLELLVGITRDPVWGPMLSVGLGGVLVEVMADVQTAPLPVSRDEVKEMLGRLRGKKLLDGYRGAKTAGIDAIADAVSAISDAALAMGGNLESLEVNPLLVGETRVEALDALAIWAE